MSDITTPQRRAIGEAINTLCGVGLHGLAKPLNKALGRPEPAEPPKKAAPKPKRAAQKAAKPQ